MTTRISADRPRLFIELPDGTEAMLSPLAPEDKNLLEEGLDHLSIESRWTRFGQGLSHLSERELEYLTNVDQRRHVAWGALVGDRAAAVGRYIVLEDSECAEVAVTVIDELQHKGLGTVLFLALAAVARADGIERFCFEVMPDNLPMKRLLEGVDVSLDDTEGLLVGEFLIADAPRSSNDDDYVEVMERVRASKTD